MRSYDSWKLDTPEYLSEPDPPQEAVGSEHGIFAWQVFCKTQRQNHVPDWAWKACRKGPFTTPLTKLIFRLEFAKARLRGMCEPDATWLAGINCIDRASMNYLDACAEVENTWVQMFSYHSVRCTQNEDYAIDLYVSEVFVDEE